MLPCSEFCWLAVSLDFNFVDAENPLSTPASTNQMKNHDASEQLGNFETEQLIHAIAKIADLLRKCWGVAGAGIISANLARTKSGKTVVFNPTIPGKRVYALFGFVAINEFDKTLRCLDKDVMKLINDVARVVHDEVYRWALGDSGQCNKNLGGAFLMVFRIGDFTEVHARKQRATDVVFNTQPKKVGKVRQKVGNANLQKRRGGAQNFDVTSGGTLQLASLPGIQTFTDRALLGFLKSFAGLHRDQNMQKWEKDFRLSAGVGKFTINVIYGMDAGTCHIFVKASHKKSTIFATKDYSYLNALMIMRTYLCYVSNPMLNNLKHERLGC